jgi:hypothetical protein
MDFESADSTDFRAGLGKFIAVLPINAICDNQLILQHHQCLIGNVGDSQQLLSQGNMLLVFVSSGANPPQRRLLRAFSLS